jgi:uncharacterized protein (DUF952 family)
MTKYFAIITQSEWNDAKQWGHIVTPTLVSLGFIECYSLKEVAGVANQSFLGEQDVLLVQIEMRLLNQMSTFSDEKNLRVQGPINLDAVVQTIAWKPNEYGMFKTQSLSFSLES